MRKKMRVPENAKKTPRCPLCYAVFAAQIIQSRVGDWWICGTCDKTTPASKEDPHKKCPTCRNDRQFHHADGKAFFCHFDKIVIMANDPMVGRWEEVLAKGDKILCPACDHEMRFFCTSTGYMKAACPVKTCRATMATAAPDRKAGEVKMLNAQGDEVVLPGVDRAAATPENPSIGQVGGGGADAALPAEGTIKLPLPGEGTA